MPDSSNEPFETETSIPSSAGDFYKPGSMVGGKYKIVERAGGGGMGTVYRVKHVFLNKDFALKVMDSRTVSAIALQRFQQEAKAASSLNHPNLVHVHDFGLIEDERPFLVMDFVDGVTFADHLKENGPLPSESVDAFFSPACFGLLAAHNQGVVHRDIKPGNLMIVRDVPLGTEGSVKVVDFGIAKVRSHESGEIQELTRTGEIFGSPLYMSPEQCTGGKVDHRSDIYSLGCVLFEMLTGTPPHLGTNALNTMMLHGSGKIPRLKEASLGKDFPQALEEIVAKMLHKSADERYQNIGLVAHDLAALCKGGALDSASKLTVARSIKLPEKISLSAYQFYGLLALTALTAAVSTGMIVHFLDHRQVQTHQKPDQLGTEPATSQSKAAPNDGGIMNDLFNDGATKLSKNRVLVENAPPISSVIELFHGELCKKFVFPSCGIGEVTEYDRFGFNKQPHRAKGIVYVPAQQILSLTIASTDAVPVLECPSILKKINSKEFRGLYLKNHVSDITAVAGIDVEPEKLQKDIASALGNVASWSLLDCVSLQSLPLDREALSALSSVKNLHYLSLTRCSLNADDLSSVPLLSHLFEFAIFKCDFNLDAMFQRLAGSSNLRKLDIQDGEISSQAIRKLAACKNLVYLEIKPNTMSDDLVTAIGELKTLRDIFINDTKLTPAQIDSLSKYRWLNTISLSSDEYTEQDLERVKSADRRFEFRVQYKVKQQSQK
jgi:serine/threonine protein kinase